MPGEIEKNHLDMRTAQITVEHFHCNCNTYNLMNRSISALISISIVHSAVVKFSMCVLFLSSQPLKFLRISLPSRSRICSLISAASNGELNSPRNRGPVAMRRDSSTAMAAIAPVRIFAEINHKI